MVEKPTTQPTPYRVDRVEETDYSGPMTRCEDAPCCGCCGTSLYGTETGFYMDEPVADDHDDWPDYCDGDEDYCPEGGCPNCSPEDHAEEFGIMEDQWLDGSYEE